MASNDTHFFAATVEGYIDHCVDNFLKAFRLELKVPQYPDENPLEKYPLEMIKDALFKGVLRFVSDKPGRMCSPGATEGTSAERAVLAPFIPAIDKAAETLYGKMEEEVRCEQAREKAREIARKTIETLLEKALPGLGLSCKFTVSEDGDRVRLELTRRYKADIDIPLPELHDFLDDPQKVIAAMAVDIDIRVDEKYPSPQSPFRYPRPVSPFGSHITFNPLIRTDIEI